MDCIVRKLPFSQTDIYRSSVCRCSSNRCSWKFHKFYRKTPVLESLFNKVTGLKSCNFMKKRSNTRVFLWNLQKTPFFTEHLRLLPLSVLYLNNWKVLSREQKKQNWAWIMRYAWENFRKCYYHHSVITW